MDDGELARLEEAEQYFLQAEFILNELQANIEVYGSNSSLSGATPANLDLAFKYLDRCLEYFPDNPKYLNLKALFVGEGLGNKEKAIEILEQAHALSPRDINIKNNLDVFKESQKSGCFIATAAFGSSIATEVQILRDFRDQKLQHNSVGRFFIMAYYYFSPPISRYISKRVWIMSLVRTLLRPVIWCARKSNS